MNYSFGLLSKARVQHSIKVVYALKPSVSDHTDIGPWEEEGLSRQSCDVHQGVGVGASTD